MPGEPFGPAFLKNCSKIFISWWIFIIFFLNCLSWWTIIVYFIQTTKYLYQNGQNFTKVVKIGPQGSSNIQYFIKYKCPINVLMVGIFQKFKNHSVQKMFLFMKPKRNKNVWKTVKITITRGYHPLKLEQGYSCNQEKNAHYLLTYRLISDILTSTRKAKPPRTMTQN